MNSNPTSTGFSASILTGLVVMALCASSGWAQTANTAPSGYWKYSTFEVTPKPETIPKPLPGRLHEERDNANLDVPGGKLGLESVWNVDDIERKAITMQSAFGIGASQSLSVLIPGQKIAVTGSASVTGNSYAAALPRVGSFTFNLMEGEYAFRIDQVKVGQSGSGKGTFVVPGGGTATGGEKLYMTLATNLRSYGGHIGALRLYYVWQQGPPPSVPNTTAVGPGPSASPGPAGVPSPGSAPTSVPSSSAATTTSSAEPAAVTKMALQAGKRKVQRGQSVTVPIWLLKAQSVANMNFNVRYDPNIAKTTGAFSKGNMLDKSLFEANPGEPGIVRVGFAQNADLSGDGTVAQLTFQASGALGTRTPLTLEVTTISGAGGGKPTIELIHGEILVVGKEGTIPGDSDGDDQITARDAGDALKMSVKLIPVRMVCDVDNDEQVTSTDARLILATASGK